MKIAAIALIVISIAVIAYLGALTPAPPDTVVTVAAPQRDDVTLRHTRAGDVVGFIGDRGARTWRGVPYAEPPVGPLRWRAPQAPRSWEGVKETLSSRPRCPQLQANSGSGGPASPPTVLGDEDCLYLDLYAPANARRLPVMVWIHGGGNSVGTGTTYNGSALATSQNVVVITINYRLGPLGWFAHPALGTSNPADRSGNFGTLDIIAALQWTHDNVEPFGGDPDRVTVFGESAGASNILTLVASPLARGLFHGGIVQSGSYATLDMAHARDFREDGGHAYSAREITNQLLQVQGLAEDAREARAVQSAMTEGELRDYLRDKTPHDLLTLFDSGNFGMLPTPEVFADGHVLPKLSAEQTFASAANHNRVPMILGTNRDEPSLFLAAQPDYVDNDGPRPQLRDPERYRRAVAYGALAWKARGVDSLAEQFTRAGNPKVFAYRFDWDEQGVVGGVDLTALLGAAHGVELPFVFGDFDSGFMTREFYAASPGKEALAHSIMAYWAEFAATGDPGTGRDHRQPHWLAWGTDGKTTLILDTPSDQGIFMSDGVVSARAIKDALARDPEIPDNTERCALYVSLFGNRPAFEPDEFAAFGPEGCAGYDAGSGG